jgi:NhaP-type Na+/H+ or K+/H+ antiporter
MTCLAYGLTELVHGYGFLAVFVAALTLRASERSHRYHADLHSFAEQIERLFMMALLVCFGAAIAEGSIFGAISGAAVLAAVLILFLVRPAAAWISLLGAPQPAAERGIIAFFGIRGLGSFYYLAFALGVAEFDRPNVLWVIVCLVVLASIILHGTTVTPAMKRLDRGRHTE